MKIFDLLIYFFTIASTAFFVFELLKLPHRAELIADKFAFSDCDTQDDRIYKAEQFKKRQHLYSIELLKLILIAVGGFALCLITFFLGSTPTQFETISNFVIIPILILIIGTTIATLIISKFSFKISFDKKIFEKPDDYLAARVLSYSQIGFALLTSFFIFLTVFFTIFHSLYLLNLL